MIELAAIPGWLISTVISAGRFALSWLRTGAIDFGSPTNGASEDHLVWWHVPVRLTGKLPPAPRQDVVIDLIMSEPISRTLRLCWRTMQGPQERITLVAGETYYIPVVARSTLNSFMLATQAGMVIPPGTVSEWVLDQGVARITDAQHYFAFVGVTNLTGSGIYAAKLRISAGDGVVAEKPYLIAVPPPNESNANFVLSIT